jgi:hypothetical protein
MSAMLSANWHGRPLTPEPTCPGGGVAGLSVRTNGVTKSATATKPHAHPNFKERFMPIEGTVSRIFYNLEAKRVFLQLVGNPMLYDFNVESQVPRRIGLTKPGDDVVIEAFHPEESESYVRTWTNKTLDAEVND